MGYLGVNWQNKPSTVSPINRGNLEIMDNGIYSAYTKAEVTNHEKVISHHETVTAGAYNYMFPNYIPEGVNVKVKNVTNTATQFNVVFIKEDGTTYSTGDYLTPGVEKEYTVDFDIYGLRSYVNLTDWNFEIRYGEGLADETVRYDKEQNKTTAEKTQARENINAANEDDMVQIQSEMQDVQNDLYVNEIMDIFGSDFTNAYIAWSDGTITSFSDGRVSDFIEVIPGDELEYSLTAIGGVTAVIAAYDSGKNYLQSKSVKGIGSGSWQLNTGSYSIPEGVSYIRFESCRTTLQSDSIVYKKKVKLKDYITENVDSDLVWNEKKWAAFGTSITDTSYVDPTFLMPTGKYVPYLVQLSGLKVTNYGIAGASFLSNIMNKVKSVDLSSFDLVTIEGAVNDHATSKPIGEVGDTGDTTFAGTIYQMANYVYSNSNATLVFITDHVGRYVHINPAPDGSDFYGDCAPSKKNNYDLLQIDYINMIAKQCEYFGIPCIMAGQEASINLMTGNLYLVDHIHQSYVGGKQYAQAIWRELKTIKPRVLTVS